MPHRRVYHRPLWVAATLGLLFAATAAPAQDKGLLKEAPRSAPKDAPKVTPAPAPARPGVTPQTQKVNELLAAAWKANNVKPSAPAGNHEFLRRVYLDLIGRIATPAEVRDFERNPSRSRLVHRLLYEKVKIEGKEFDYPEEFARNWANIWTVWLMTRSANPVYRDQMRVWMEEHFARNGSHKEMVEKLLTATGKNTDNGAVNYILQHLGEPVPRGKEREEGHFDVVPLTSRTTRLFLGQQTQCVQCHDHKFYPEWKQSHFWGVNVFFRQVNRPEMLARQNNRGMAAPALSLVDDADVNPEGMISFEKQSGVVLYTKATFLDGRKMDLPAGSRTRRQVLAELITTSDQFPKAYVNRIWGHLFGRGMNEQPAVDDFGEHNKVIHPELLDLLAREFASETPEYEPGRGNNAYDPRKLLFWVCTSDAYGLSSVPNATNDKPEAEVYFSRMLLKALTPEQLFESLAQATGAYSGSSSERKKKREEWLKKLVVNFGDDEGNEITFNGTLLQALMLMNGKDLGDALHDTTKGTVAEAIRKSRGNPSRAIDELFLAALNRHPTSKESSDIGRAARKYGDGSSLYFLSDVFWALLNSNEFILNH